MPERTLNPDQTVEHLPVVTHCLNCGVEVVGNFCHVCGQQASEMKVRIIPLLRELTGDWLGFDSVFWKTLNALVRWPGVLTQAFNSGQRVRYLAPTRLYLLVSIVFFFIYVNFDPISPDQIFAQDEIQAELRESGTSYDLFRDRWDDTMRNTLVFCMFIVIPLLALGLKLFYIGTKRYLVEHLVFSLHFVAFFLLSWIPAALLANQILYLAATAGALVYLYTALRRVYRQSIPMTIIKTLLVYFFFLSILLLYIFFSAGAALSLAAG